jgi:hypothetical protein
MQGSWVRLFARDPRKYSRRSDEKGWNACTTGSRDAAVRFHGRNNRETAIVDQTDIDCPWTSSFFDLVEQESCPKEKD